MALEPTQQVGVGSHVEVELLDEAGNGECMSFDLVYDSAASITQGLLSADSPLGKAIRGKFVGSVVPYIMGDICQIRILSVAPAQTTPTPDAAERRRATLEEARQKAERTNAEMFASSYDGKWGDYTTDEVSE